MCQQAASRRELQRRYAGSGDAGEKDLERRSMSPPEKIPRSTITREAGTVSLATVQIEFQPQQRSHPFNVV